MTLRPVIKMPNEGLDQVCKDANPEEVRELIEDLFETMYALKGLGLAAPQIGKCRRVIVLDAGEEESTKWALINPVITETSEETDTYNEGCLSAPDQFVFVTRPSEITIRYNHPTSPFDPIERKFAGMEAKIIQHEIDHLNGITFLKYASRPVRRRILAQMKKKK